MNISIRELKQFNAEITQLEDTIALAAFGKTMRSEYEAHGIPVPEWLDDANRRLSRAIDEQTLEAKELRLKELRAQQDGLKSREERKQAVAAELAVLEAELAAKK